MIAKLGETRGSPALCCFVFCLFVVVVVVVFFRFLFSFAPSRKEMKLLACAVAYNFPFEI